MWAERGGSCWSPQGCGTWFVWGRDNGGIFFPWFAFSKVWGFCWTKEMLWEELGIAVLANTELELLWEALKMADWWVDKEVLMSIIQLWLDACRWSKESLWPEHKSRLCSWELDSGVKSDSWIEAVDQSFWPAHDRQGMWLLFAAGLFIVLHNHQCVQLAVSFYFPGEKTWQGNTAGSQERTVWRKDMREIWTAVDSITYASSTGATSSVKAAKSIHKWYSESQPLLMFQVSKSNCRSDGQWPK